MTTRFGPGELEAAREDLADLLPHTFTVRRRPAGGGAWADVGTWAGRWRMANLGDAATSSPAAAALSANVVVRMDAAADVKVGDNLFAGGYPDGQRLEVALVAPAPLVHLTVWALMEEAA